MLDPRYQQLHRELEHLRFETRDSLGDHDHPQARSILQSTDRLLQNVRAGHNLYDIQRDIRELETHIETARRTHDDSGSPVLNEMHGDRFHDTYRNMREDMQHNRGIWRQD